MDQLDDYQLMEPSPSPPATPQVARLDLCNRDSKGSYDTGSDDLLWPSSASPSSPSASQPQNSTEHTRSRGGIFANTATSEAGLSSHPKLSIQRSASHSYGASQRCRNSVVNRERSRSASAVGGVMEPLSTNSVNAFKTSSQSKRRTGSPGAAVPAPVFTWEEKDNVCRMSGGSDVQVEEGQTEDEHCRRPSAAPRWSSSLRQERNRVSGSTTTTSTSQQRRSSVLGPDPRDCIDLCNDDVVQVEAQASPLPYGEEHRAALSLAYDLTALVNAGSVGRCLSNSRGQVDLIDDDNTITEEVTKEEERTYGCAEPAHHSDDYSDSSNGTGDDSSACFEFEHEYFYHPATSSDVKSQLGSSDGSASVQHWAETPRHTVSAPSPSSSMPRWVRSLAEETPFTPFSHTATGVVTAPPTFLHVNPAATEEQMMQGLVVASDRAQPQPQQHQQQHRKPTKCLRVHELVESVLSSPPICIGTASDTSAPELGMAPTPMSSTVDEEDDGSESQSEEPLPRRPPDHYDERTLAERERVFQRVHDTRARLAHVDQLLARFNLAVEARQTELETLRGKHAVLAQQTENYLSRAATATREVRHLRQRQHGQDEVRLLCDMMTDKENRLHVAQSQLSSLQRLWKQLQLLCTTKKENVDEATDETVHDEEDAEAESKESSHERESMSHSPTSSDASLNTCSALEDFLEELLSEVEGLAKVCIQLPSAPPPAPLSSCKNNSNSSAVQHSGDIDPQDPQHAKTTRPRPTHAARDHGLREGSHGFFSFFGGATEAHLDSKPLSTFLANLDRLARTSWEREEELQLRARELATEEEENDLKTRLALEHGVKLKQPQPLRNWSSSIKSSGGAGEVNALSPLSVGALSREREEEHLGNGSSNETPTSTSPASLLTPQKNTVVSCTDRTRRQLLLSSPEHGRRSRGNSAGLRTPSKAATPSSRLHHRVNPAPLLLPTLVYAYPRMAAVSQHLDAEQQKIQADYAAAIETERQNRRQLTARLRDTYRQDVAPTLRRTIAALRQQQTVLARQLAELGVKAVTIQWEEEEPKEVDDTALLQAINGATSTDQNDTSVIRRCGAARDRSRNRASTKATAQGVEVDNYGDAASSRGTSLTRLENGAVQSIAAAMQPCHVYRRTLSIACSGTCKRGTTTEAEKSSRLPVSSQPHSSRHPREPTIHQDPISARPSTARGCLSARSARKRPSATLHPSVTPAEQNTTAPSTGSLATALSRECAALQLCTHPLTKTPLGQTDAHIAADEKKCCTTAAAVNTAVMPIATALFRRSGGTPRASGAPATARTSTADCSARSSRGHASTAVPSSPRHSYDCAAPSSSAATGPKRRHSHPPSRPVSARAGRSAAPCSSSQDPVVDDVRELVAPADSTSGASVGVTTSTPTPAKIWTPFEHTRKALSDGAVRVAITFTGKEARRRQAAQSRREAYQREFWELREELARIDEDTFQLRTRWIELQSVQQATVTEQRTKLEEAEAKAKKCRAFYETLRQENGEWKSIRDELKRVIRGEEKI
ncbi:hypothetical protein JKF63_06587 [Porcisia hertigi]|uniref:Uncharacterized protein n=1 Tax=Porcisia hertigi TaxID=2761500 RepID=A0A836LIJ8_9TRYP|nr:hypothetical protein JKF63_06587 [Porcisia hertigi]